ncbi:MAG: FGGY family carbohydrate kinase [Pirellulaceae bacterium]|nr:FGGY family carbohydrate kinase [Pirellulaceae bacterium]
MAQINLIGIDETTSARALAVRGDDGQEGFATRAIAGATNWNGNPAFPAFDLASLPGMFRDMLDELAADGFVPAKTGRISISCRQHDMVVLDREGKLLLPALMWQCNAADEETKTLNNDPLVTGSVGSVEPRLVLPKLLKVLAVEKSLRERVWTVLTTGDYVAYLLTGQLGLNSSEAKSNGLFDRNTQSLPLSVLDKYQLPRDWFSPLLRSGEVVGTIGGGPAVGLSGDWQTLRERLAGWHFCAGLGDNHASGVGCGVTDSGSLLASLGTSGTNNWVSEAAPPAVPGLLGFGYYDATLWLNMLHHCAAWYNRFLDEFAAPLQDDHETLNRLADQSEPAELVRVPYCQDQGESYPPGWTRLSLKVKVASVQFSILCEMLARMRSMLAAIDAQKLKRPDRFILTGGLSQSPFAQHLFHAGVKLLAGESGQPLLSGRSGPLRYKTTAYGALINAEFYGDVTKIPAARFPTVPCPAPAGRQAKGLRERLKLQLA